MNLNLTASLVPEQTSGADIKIEAVLIFVGSNVEDLFLSVLASLVVSGCVLSRGGLFVPGAALHFPVSSLPTCSALGIFCWAEGVPWGVMLGAVSTGVLLLLFLSLSLSLSFPLAFLRGSLAYGVDIFGAASCSSSQ